MTGSVPPHALERWFASLARPPRIDLAGSGAPPLALVELLSLASSEERREFETVSLGYGPPDGTEALREAIAARQSGIAAAHVLVTCGAIEALHLAVAALVGPGDEVVVQHPMYPAVAGLAQARGARVVRWALDAERGFRASVAALGPLLSSATRLVAVTQPNSPTGSVLEAGELDALVDVLDERGIWLLSDEVYRELVLEPRNVVPSAVGRYPRAIAIGDVAKPYGLGGLRIGWLATRAAEARERTRTLRDYTTLSVPTPSDVLARIALRNGAALLARPLANARANLRQLDSFAARDHALSFAPPPAGVTAFVRVADAPRVQRALFDEGVLVVPGGLFGHPDRVRIGLAGPTDDFAVALGLLARILAPWVAYSA